MRSIAIPVAQREECELALDVAFTLAKRLGADVAGYHMKVLQKALSSEKATIASLWAAGGMSAAAWPMSDERGTELLADKSRELFYRQADAHGYTVARSHGRPEAPRAVYQEIMGTPDQAIPVFGPANDLLVVTRPARKGAIKAWMVMMSALLDTDTPVLILPQKKTAVTGERIVIAWNNGSVEAQLLRAMMPLLRQASEVTLVTIGKATKQGPSAKRMSEYLKAWGVSANHKALPDADVGKSLEQACRDLKADLLISGAYTRGRVREMIFGGVTEYLVSQTQLPVIMLHQ